MNARPPISISSAPWFSPEFCVFMWSPCFSRGGRDYPLQRHPAGLDRSGIPPLTGVVHDGTDAGEYRICRARQDRKSTRLNSSHLVISYAVFCLKKKTEKTY